MTTKRLQDIERRLHEVARRHGYTEAPFVPEPPPEDVPLEETQDYAVLKRYIDDLERRQLKYIEPPQSSDIVSPDYQRKPYVGWRDDTTSTSSGVPTVVTGSDMGMWMPASMPAEPLENPPQDLTSIATTMPDGKPRFIGMYNVQEAAKRGYVPYWDDTGSGLYKRDDPSVRITGEDIFRHLQEPLPGKDEGVRVWTRDPVTDELRPARDFDNEEVSDSSAL